MKKTKLALDLLEQEMELLSVDEQAGFVGGSSGWYEGVWWPNLPPGLGVPDEGGGNTGGGSGTGEGGDSGNWIDDFFENNPAGHYTVMTDSGGTYIMDNTFYESESGDLYFKTSDDGGITWDNHYSEFQGNWFDSTYIGPDNPEGYYWTTTNMADFFAMVHDIQYDSERAAGLDGMLVDLNTLHADLQLIASEASVAAGEYDSDVETRLEALGVYLGISVGVMIKLVINMSSFANH
jgi:hypothetical protein